MDVKVDMQGCGLGKDVADLQFELGVKTSAAGESVASTHGRMRQLILPFSVEATAHGRMICLSCLYAVASIRTWLPLRCCLYTHGRMSCLYAVASTLLLLRCCLYTYGRMSCLYTHETTLLPLRCCLYTHVSTLLPLYARLCCHGVVG